jgi:hypothetical protein
MMAKYSEGQRVKILKLIDGFGRPDPRLEQYIDKTGTIVKSYCISPDEIWEKMLIVNIVYCYDVRLEGDGTIVRGIPEVALEPYLSRHI